MNKTINNCDSKVNKKNFKEKGITLIALIVMIMVLVILAAVTVTSMTGENSLLNKASVAGDKTNEEGAKEKLRVEISDLITERAIYYRSATLDELDQRLSKNKLYQTRKQGSRYLIVGLDGYAFRVDTNLKIVETVNVSLLTNIEMEYKVNSINGNTMNITIIARSSKDLDKLITPDENETYPTDENKNKIETNYSVTVGEEYTIKAKLSKSREIREFKLTPSTEDIPAITNVDSEARMMLTEDGLITMKNAQIDYGTNTDNYYSTDDGETWIKYENKAIIDRQCTLLAKSFSTEDIVTKVATRSITLNLSGNAMQEGGTVGTTWASGGGSALKRIYIHENLQGRKIYIKVNRGGDYTTKILQYSSTDVPLKDDRISGNYSSSYYEYKEEIRTGTDYIGFYADWWYRDYTSWMTVREVKLDDTPFIAQKTTVNAVIKESGFEKYNELITLTYDATSIQRLYKIGENAQWINYDNTPIKVEVGETLYAKGINKRNEESLNVFKYELGLPGGAFDINTTMGYSWASGGGSVTKRMDVENGLQGRSINMKINRAGDYTTKITYHSSDGTQLKENNIKGSYGDNQYDYNETIPQNTAYINFYVDWWYRDYTAWMNVHEVSIVPQE